MSEKFTIEIITPEKLLLKTEAIEVIIPSYDGQMGIMKNHIPLITFLRPGLVIVKSEDEKKFYVEEGTIEFSDNNLLVLTSTAKEISSLEKNSLDNLIIEAEKKLNSDKITDKEKYFLSYKLATLKDING